MTSRTASDLAEEYKLLVHRWDDFDRRALTIKSWVAAGMLVAVTKLDEMSPAALLGAIAVSLAAWYLEAVWKAWQHCNGPRLSLLEAHFRGEGEPGAPYQIHAAWVDRWKSRGWCWPMAEILRPFVLLPYAPFIVLFAFEFFSRLTFTVLPPS